MEISSTTKETLKNFAGINQGIIVKKGSKLRTISISRDIYAEAILPDEFPKDFAIYDLGEFLSTLSLLDKPNIRFTDDSLLLESGKQKIKYYYSSESVVVAPPEQGGINLQNPNIRFKLELKDFEQIQRASSVMKLKHIVISRNKITVETKSEGSGGNKLEISIPDMEFLNDEVKDGDFEYTLSVDNFKFIPKEYTVEAESRGIVKFSAIGLTYYVTTEEEWLKK